jgi:hypothetical protein
MAHVSIANKETLMARTEIPAIQSTSISVEDIDQAVARGRALRSQAFTTMLRSAYQALTNRSAKQRPALDKTYPGCASTA